MQYEQPATLPLPDEASALHSAKVGAHIREKIRAGGGRISFASYMHEALYAPGLGYYSAGSTKFGASGDFITAPDVSSVFGRILARQCAEVSAGIEDAELLEVGAGNGKLAVDLLTALDELDALPKAYNILEVSADLQDRQMRRIADEVPRLADRVRWLSDLPRDFSGVIVANEVLDALPVERFEIKDSKLSQLYVGTDGDGFVWISGEPTDGLAKALAGIEELKEPRLQDNYRSEISLAGRPWIADLAASLDRGAVFLFDYGVSRREYYAPDRVDGWLRCHFRHFAHSDPFIYPGIQDLTSWVDFTSIASAGTSAGFDILGYTTQSQFLMSGGLEIEMRGLANMPVARQIELSGQIKTLTLPTEMGENFKCIAFGRGEVVSPTAFDFADRTHTL